MIAIPETINASSIGVVGQWDSFNVTWAPAERVNVNNSRVYYDVSLTFPDLNKIEVRNDHEMYDTVYDGSPFNGLMMFYRSQEFGG